MEIVNSAIIKTHLIPAMRDIRMIFCGISEQSFIHIRLDLIISVYEADPLTRPVTDNIGTVGKILLRHAGSVKKMGAGLYIVTEDEGATVGIREGWNVKKCRPVVKGPSGDTVLFCFALPARGASP